MSRYLAKLMATGYLSSLSFSKKKAPNECTSRTFKSKKERIDWFFIVKQRLEKHLQI
ncbi:MAG: hypothetical protein ACI9JY_001454 [Saprospiraceae bacterium]|jgi:hypothetical protein